MYASRGEGRLFVRRGLLWESGGVRGECERGDVRSASRTRESEKGSLTQQKYNFFPRESRVRLPTGARRPSETLSDLGFSLPLLPLVSSRAQDGLHAGL